MVVAALSQMYNSSIPKEAYGEPAQNRYGESDVVDQ
jgi:hypothetical protein